MLGTWQHHLEKTVGPVSVILLRLIKSSLSVLNSGLHFTSVYLRKVCTGKQQKTAIINYDSRPFLSLFMFLISVKWENIGTSEKDRDIIAYN